MLMPFDTIVSIDVKYPTWSSLKIEKNQNFFCLELEARRSLVPIFPFIQYTVQPGLIKLAANKKFQASLRSAAAVLKNKILDVHQPFFTILQLRGVNFKFFFTETMLHLEIGKSYTVKIQIPPTIFIIPLPANKDFFIVRGFDRTAVLDFIYILKKQKPVNSYTGSGLVLLSERTQLKEGKKK